MSHQQEKEIKELRAELAATKDQLARTGQSLQQAELTLQGMLESTADGIIVADKDDKILYKSNRILKTLGFEGKDWNETGEEWMINAIREQFVDPDAYLKKARELRRSKETCQGSFRLKNGTIIEYYTRPLIINDQHEGRVWSYRNVTEKTRAIENAEAIGKQLHGMYEAASNVAFIITDNSKPFPVIQEFSPGAAKIFQYTKDEVLDKPVSILYTPDVLPRIEEALKALEHKSGLTAFPTARKKNGECFPALVSLYPLTDELQNITRIVGVGFDLTEQRDVERALQLSRKRSRNIIDSSPMGMHFYEIDDQGALILIDHNQAADDITGIETKNRLGQSIEEAFPNLKGTEIPERYRRAALFGEQYANTDVIYKDEHIQGAFEIQAFQTAPRQMAVMFRDVTQSKQIEEKLQLSEKKYRRIFQNIQDIYFELDLDRTIIELSPSVSKISKYTREELLGQKIDVLSTGDGLMFTILQKIMDEGEVTNLDLTLGDKDDSILFCSVNVRVEKDKNGNPVKMIGSLRDVTDREQAREEIVRLSRAIEQSPSSVVITDTNGVIQYVNPKFCELTGYSQEEAIGRNPSILKSGSQPPEMYKTLWETILKGEEWRGEFLNKRKDGTTFWEMASISAIKNSKGEITNFLGIKEDITERKKVEAQLREAKERAEESDRLKSAFLANMSHEIRTPMNAILGFSELLQDENISAEDVNQYISFINTKGRELMALISDLIDISRIEAGDVNLHKCPLEINPFLEQIMESFREEKVVTAKPEVSIRMNLPDDPSPVCVTDRNRLSQIINNLLSNAVKFTENGFIELGYTTASSHIICYIQDTGIGIPEDKIPLIFERFRQADEHITRRFGGTGLGLAISKQMTDLLGGSMWVESVPGQGSTFFFKLPLSRKKRKQAKDTSQTRQAPKNDQDLYQSKKILIAEDDSSNYLFLESLLRKSNAELVWAKDGQQAVDIFTRNQDSDLIIMDIRMPVKDGLEATREIRKIDDKVPIIALTAFAFADDREKSMSAGCDEYLTKPVKPQVLKEILNRYLEVN